jgi:hypothetical protein
MSDSQKPQRSRARKAVGPDRPTYLHPEDIDKVMAIVLALMSETASIRARLDTHERLAAAGLPATPEAVEAFRPEPAVEAEREIWRQAYIKRLLRVMLEELDVAPAEAS